MRIDSYSIWLRARAIWGPATASLIAHTISAFGRILRAPLKIASARRELRLLATLSDRELSDIGIARYDLVEASKLALDVDPGDFLMQKIEERRSARLAQLREANLAMLPVLENTPVEGARQASSDLSNRASQ